MNATQDKTDAINEIVNHVEKTSSKPEHGGQFHKALETYSYGLLVQALKVMQKEEN